MDSPAQKQGTWLTNIVDTNGATIHMFGMSATNSIRSIFVFTDRDWNFIISSVVPSLRVVKDGLVRVLKHHHRRHSDIPLSLQPKNVSKPHFLLPEIHVFYLHRQLCFECVQRFISQLS